MTVNVSSPKSAMQADLLTLETLVDSNTLCTVLQYLSSIAAEKAQHIEETWQDAALAKEWTKAEKLLDALAHKMQERKL